MMLNARNEGWKRLSKPFFFVFALFYLGFHTVSGERGVYAMLRETHKITQLKAEFEETKAKRQAIEHKVKLLSASSLDLDMLDEQAHRVLGVAAPDEILIFAPQQK